MHAMNQATSAIGYGNAATATSPVAPSEIDREVNRIANGHSLLESAIEGLFNRLDCVVCQPPPSDAKPSVSEACGSRLGSQLQSEAQRAHSAAGRIEYLMSCLRV